MVVILIQYIRNSFVLSIAGGVRSGDILSAEYPAHIVVHWKDVRMIGERGMCDQFFCKPPQVF